MIHLSKFFLVICLLIISSSAILAQYRPTLKEGREWINHYDRNGFGDFTAATRVIGDSLVNGVSYKVLRRDLVVDQYLMREDSVARQIFLLDSTGMERLIYDFSLQPGDTCYCSYDSPTEGYVVIDSITHAITEQSWCADSIELSLANPRIFHVRPNLGQPIFWIEGIGSYTELRDSDGMFWYQTFLLCHFDETGERDYHFRYGDCSDPESCFDYVGIADDFAHQINISPNPFTDRFTVTIETPAIGIEEIRVLNLNGQLIARYPLNGLTSRTIDLSSLATGVWLISLTDKEGQISVQKMMKQ